MFVDVDALGTEFAADQHASGGCSSALVLVGSGAANSVLSATNNYWDNMNRSYTVHRARTRAGKKTQVLSSRGTIANAECEAFCAEHIFEFRLLSLHGHANLWALKLTIFEHD